MLRDHRIHNHMIRFISLFTILLIIIIDKTITPCSIYLLNNRVNTVDQHGWTPLMYACDPRNSGVPNRDSIEALLEAGSNPNQRNPEGRTPLAILLRSPQVDLGIVKMLLDYGGNPNLSDKHGHTPLMIAFAFYYGNNRDSLIQLLINSGADVNQCDAQGVTVLSMAIFSSISDPNLKLIRLLIEAGIDVNARGANDRTALMWVSMLCSPSRAIVGIPYETIIRHVFGLARLLIEAGAGVHVIDNQGYNALAILDGYDLRGDENMMAIRRLLG